MPTPVEWRNKSGYPKWQPQASDESRLWINYWDDDNSGVWRMEGDTPVLTSYRKAVKLGEAEDRRMHRAENVERFEEYHG